MTAADTITVLCTPGTESDATLRLQQQILAAVTDDPGAVPDLLIDLGLIDRAGACRVVGAMKAAGSELCPLVGTNGETCIYGPGHAHPQHLDPTGQHWGGEVNRG